jgi:hypothetical protein
MRCAAVAADALTRARCCAARAQRIAREVEAFVAAQPGGSVHGGSMSGGGSAHGGALAALQAAESAC